MILKLEGETTLDAIERNALECSVSDFDYVHNERTAATLAFMFELIGALASEMKPPMASVSNPDRGLSHPIDANLVIIDGPRPSEAWIAKCRHCGLEVDMPLSCHEPCSNGALHDFMRYQRTNEPLPEKK